MMANEAKIVVGGEAMAQPHDRLKYLFVITYGRSGSTLLLRLINSIDGYCIRGENHGISTYLSEAWSVLMKARADYGEKSSEPWMPWYGIGDAQAEAFGISLAADLCQHVLRPTFDTKVIGFKEVRFSPYDISDREYDTTIKFLANNFVDSRFIFNTRNWREVANSGWWREFWSIKSVKKIVEQSNIRFYRSQELLGSRAFTIDYAEYNKNPAGFDELLKWLGEDVEKSIIEDVLVKKLDHAKRKFRPRGLKSRLKRLTRLIF